MLRLTMLTIAVVLLLVSAAESATPSQPVYQVVYSLADLPVYGVGNKFDPSLLIAYLKATVDPEGWQNGIGQVAAFDANLSIVVAQTADNHKKINRSLELLRSKNSSK